MLFKSNPLANLHQKNQQSAKKQHNFESKHCNLLDTW